MLLCLPDQAKVCLSIASPPNKDLTVVVLYFWVASMGTLLSRIIKDLFNRTDKADENTLAECFVSLSYLRGDVFPLIQYFVGDEFMSGGIAGALMRENVIASKLIKAYIRTFIFLVAPCFSPCSVCSL